ncbi:AIPR family protein [Rhodovulum sulfidophilum]|uniref:AIPR family protein n=1 Tax=Rhodovulum sulfidophilum TaxID=35806 RepID=UPI0019244C81|nr:AIPR family protein [Rhodovulum sulfidophilum]MBL3561104.1 AIPR family protein [Rhodovulum sulfidophilum]
MSVQIKRGFISDAVAATSEELGIGEDDAFMYWFYSILFDVEVEDVPFDEIVDGAGERQIDMFRIDIDDSTQSVDIHLIQVKNTNGFSANTVSLMKAGIEFIFLSPRDVYRATPNTKLLEKVENARQAIRQYGNNSVRIQCYFVTLGDESDISTEAAENRDSILRVFRDSSVFGGFDFHFVGVNEIDRINNLRRNRGRKINANIPIIYDANRASIVEFDTAGVRSVLCTVTGAELAKLAQTEPRDAIFDANVRGNLGLGGQVNKSIYSSATDDSTAEHFWFMNNGITMVCDRLSVVRDPDEPSVKVENVQIINGCQTTSSLRSALEDGKLSNSVKVQLKLYESKDPIFIDNVVIATNNQNSIGSRDLHANDEVQQLIQRKIQEDFGLFYERKRGEAKSAGVPKSDVVSLEKAGQAYLAIFKSQPTVSRAQKYKIYSQELYEDVFSRSQPWQLAVAHEIYRYADYHGRKAYRELDVNDPTRNILNYGVFHICRIVWWVLVNEFCIGSRDSKNLMQIARDGGGLIDFAYGRAKDIMSEIVEENNESLVNLNNYFKKSQSQQNINQYLKRIKDEQS